jgi:hypothetical protein
MRRAICSYLTEKDGLRNPRRKPKPGTPNYLKLLPPIYPCFPDLQGQARGACASVVDSSNVAVEQLDLTFGLSAEMLRGGAATSDAIPLLEIRAPAEF